MPPAFEVSGLQGEKDPLRLYADSRAEAEGWLFKLQEAIRRSRTPGGSKKGYLRKEATSGMTGIEHQHSRWFVVLVWPATDMSPRPQHV